MRLRPLVPPLIALCLSWLGFAAVVQYTSSALPEMVNHAFSRSAAVTTVATRSEYCRTMIGVGLAPLLLLFGIGVVTNVLRWRISGIPRRDYWFAPEREVGTREFITRQFGWLAAGIVWFVAGFYFVALSDNAPAPSGYSTIAGIVFVSCAIAFIGWFLHFQQHFLEGDN